MSTIKTPAVCGQAICGQAICGQSAVVKAVMAIRITKYPNKMVYMVGEKFDSTGLSVNAVYTDGSEKTVEIQNITINPSGALKVKDNTVTISYNGYAAKLPIIVQESNKKGSKTAAYDCSPAPLQIVRNLNRAGTGVVDLFTGDLTFTHKDVSYLGERLPLTISHIYNSQIAQNEGIDIDGQRIKPISGFGKGWSLNLTQRIFIYSFDNNQNNKIEDGERKIIYLDANGQTHTFISTIRKGMQYDSLASIFIDEKGSGQTIAEKYGLYKLYDDSGNVLKFDGISGRLYEIATNDGATMKIEYDNNKDYDNSRIISVTDGAQRTATFEYNDQKMLTCICEITGKKTRYIYDDNNRLIRIEYLGNNNIVLSETIFSYSGETALLTSVTDPIGYRLGYDYCLCANEINVVSRVSDNTTIEEISHNGVKELEGNNDDFINILHYKNSGSNNTSDYTYNVKTKTKSGIVQVYHFNSTGSCCLQYESETDYEFFSPKGILHYNYTDNYTLQTLKIPNSKNSTDLLVNGDFEKYQSTGGVHVVNNIRRDISLFDNWVVDKNSATAESSSNLLDGRGHSIQLNGSIYQDIDLSKIKSHSHYLLSGWAWHYNIDSCPEDKINGLFAIISYKDGSVEKIYIPIDKKHNGIQFIGKIVYIDDVSKVQRIRIELKDEEYEHAFGTNYDGLRFEEIQEVVSIENIPCLIVDTGAVYDSKRIYKKYDYNQVVELSVTKGSFTTKFPIDKNNPVTPYDFYIMYLNDKCIYCKAMDKSAVGAEDAFVKFNDGSSYRIKYTEVYNSGKIITTANGNRTVQEKDEHKDVISSTYMDVNDNTFKSTCEYNDQHKAIKSIDYRSIVAQNTFGDTEISSAIFPYGGTQKIVSAQGYTDSKNHVLYETDERHTEDNAIKRIFEYDLAGNITKCTFPDGSVVCCDYDIYTGLPIRMYSDINGQHLENKYTYFKGLLVKIDVNDLDEYTFDYDGYGDLTGVFYNGVRLYRAYTQFGYDYYEDNINNFDYTENSIADKTYRTYFDRYGKALKTSIDGRTLAEYNYDSETDAVTSVKDYSVNIETNKSDDIISYVYGYDVDSNNSVIINMSGCGHSFSHRNVVENDRIAKEEMFIDGELQSYVYSYESKNGAIYPDNTVRSIEYFKGTTNSFSANYTNDDYGRFSCREIREEDGSIVCKEQRAYLNVANISRTTNYVSDLTNTAKGFSQQMGYTYSKNGEILTVSENSLIVERYKYDALGRLVREDNRAFNKTVVYSYDTFGDIISKTVSAFSLSDNAPTGAVKSYAYATGGIRGKLISYNGKNLTAYANKPYSDYGYPQVYFKHGSSDYWKMQWNGSSLKNMRLCNSVGTEKADNIIFLYNGSGIRIRKTANGTSTDYIYMGSKLLRETKNEYRIDYTYGADGINGFELTRSKGISERYYYLKDLQGDITHILDKNGSVVVNYKYDAWGNCRVCDPDGTENGDEDFIGNINPIRYRGYYYDVETKLYYLISRYYDSEVGRFISPDSVVSIDFETLGRLNLYAYCGDNAVMFKQNDGSNQSTSKNIIEFISSPCDLEDNDIYVPEWLKIAVGALPDLITGANYLMAKGMHVKFAYKTEKQFIFPILGSTWKWFTGNTKFRDLYVANIKQLLTGNARAGIKSIFKSIGVNVGITAGLNFLFNYIEHGGGKITWNMLQDTLIDTAVGLGAYYLASGTMSLITTGLLYAGVTVPGAAVIIGIIVLSIGFDWLIRTIFNI